MPQSPGEKLKPEATSKLEKTLDVTQDEQSTLDKSDLPPTQPEETRRIEPEPPKAKFEKTDNDKDKDKEKGVDRRKEDTTKKDEPSTEAPPRTPRKKDSSVEQKKTAESKTPRRATKKELEKDGVEDESYFHGFIDLDDLPEFLRRPGDFAVHYNIDSISERTQLFVMSVAVENQPPRNKPLLQSFNAAYVDKSVTFDRKNFFPTWQQLVNFHYKQKSFFLKTGVKRQPWELKWNQIELAESGALGQGKYGGVSRGKVRTAEGQIMSAAIKLLAENDENSIPGESPARQMLAEARTMRRVSHTNIVRLLGVVNDKEPIAIVMELMDGPCLAKALREHQLPDEKRLRTLVGVLFGLMHIHSKRIVHRDIAARNCLLRADFNCVKICDFGLSRTGPIYRVQGMRAIALKWTAPEAISLRQFSYKSDVWAFGILAWEVYTDGQDPYPNMDSAETKRFLLEQGGKLAFPKDGKVPVPARLPELVAAHCFEHEAQKRSSMIQVGEAMRAVIEGQPDSVKKACMEDYEVNRTLLEARDRSNYSNTSHNRSSEQMRPKPRSPSPAAGLLKSARRKTRNVKQSVAVSNLLTRKGSPHGKKSKSPDSHNRN